MRVVVEGVKKSMMRFVYSRRSQVQYIRTVVFFPRKRIRSGRERRGEIEDETGGRTKEIGKSKGKGWRWASVVVVVVPGVRGEEPVADCAASEIEPCATATNQVRHTLSLIQLCSLRVEIQLFQISRFLFS